jgi:hypothetical protein
MLKPNTLKAERTRKTAIVVSAVVIAASVGFGFGYAKFSSWPKSTY